MRKSIVILLAFLLFLGLISCTDNQTYNETSKFLITIDAAHGGKDPGTISKSTIPEKDVVLSIAKKFATALKKAGFVVILTRTQDEFIALKDRIRIAILRYKGIQTTLGLNSTTSN